MRKGICIPLLIGVMLFLIGCQVNGKADEEGANDHQYPAEINFETAQRTVESYYSQLMAGHYQLALFHVDYGEAQHLMIRNVDALEYIDTHLEYTIEGYEIDVERSLQREEEVLFVVHLLLSYIEHQHLEVTERVTVSEIDDVYQIKHIQSEDMFLPFRSNSYDS